MRLETELAMHLDPINISWMARNLNFKLTIVSFTYQGKRALVEYESHHLWYWRWSFLRTEISSSHSAYCVVPW
jgi:hypothetical protein